MATSGITSSGTSQQRLLLLTAPRRRRLVAVIVICCCAIFVSIAVLLQQQRQSQRHQQQEEQYNTDASLQKQQSRRQETTPAAAADKDDDAANSMSMIGTTTRPGADKDNNNNNSGATEEGEEGASVLSRIDDNVPPPGGDQLLPEAQRVPHVVYDDLRYRRVCAVVHSSILCLTVRFPFEVPLQDPTATYTKPFAERDFRTLIVNHDHGAIILDGPLLEKCKNWTSHLALDRDDDENDDKSATSSSSSVIDEKVKLCLERAAGEITDPAIAAQHVHAVWTRKRIRIGIKRASSSIDDDSSPQRDDRHQHEQRQQVRFELWGTQSSVQRERALDFFDGQMTLLIGDSLSPGITRCVATLITTQPNTVCCDMGNKMFKRFAAAYECLLPKDLRRTSVPIPSWWSTMESCTKLRKPEDSNKQPSRQRRQRRLALDYALLDPKVTFIGNMRYRHDDIKGPPFHALPGDTVVERMKKEGVRNHHHQGAVPGGNATRLLRPLTIISEYPISHAQNEYMINNMSDVVRALNTKYQPLFLYAQTEAGRAELAEMGFELRRIIAFDGMPQSFEGGAYSGQEQLGVNPTCVGPVPPNNPLTSVKDMAAGAWEEHGLDARWYGSTWEFANLFWWQAVGYQNRLKRLDCTHSNSWNNSGMYCMHKYFLMSMIDDHYDHGVDDTKSRGISSNNNNHEQRR